MLKPEEQRALEHELKTRGVGLKDAEGLEGYRGELFERDQSDGSICHPEAGWSWWAQAGWYLIDLVGREGVETISAIHAWRGVAVSGDFEPFMLGTPKPIPEPVKPGSRLHKLGIGKPSEKEIMEWRVKAMVHLYSGGFENVHVVSGTRLLRELEAGVQAAGLAGVDPMELYRTVDDNDEKSIARCYLAMSCAFLRAGMEHGHCVWWMK